MLLVVLLQAESFNLKHLLGSLDTSVLNMTSGVFMDITTNITKHLAELVLPVIFGTNLSINSLTLTHGYTMSITSMAGDITLIIERWRDNWDFLLWRSSPECREMISERLALHKQAMIDGSKSPYFD